MRGIYKKFKNINGRLEQDKKVLSVNKISNAFAAFNISQNKRINNVLAKSFIQGLRNNKYIFLKPNEIWPNWINNYLKSNSCLGQGNSNFLLTNIYNQNYTLLGFPFENEKILIDPKGLVVAPNLNWSLDYWFQINGKIISPSQLDLVEQELVNNLPIVKTKFSIDDIWVTAEIFFKANLEKINYKENLFYAQVSLENSGNKDYDFSFYYAIKPYNPEGLTELKEIVYLSNNSFIVDGKLALILDQKPDNVVCLDFDNDNLDNLKNFEMIFKANCDKSLASGYAEYKIKLGAKEKFELTAKIANVNVPRIPREDAKIPTQIKTLNEKVSFIKDLVCKTEEAKVLSEWHQIKETLAEIKVPDLKITQNFENLKLHLLNFIAKEEIFSGALIYRKFCLRDLTNVIRALNRIGAAYFSEEIINNIIEHNNFPYLYEELDSLGQLIYIIYDTYEYANDKNFLEKHSYFINQIVQKIENNTVKEINDFHEDLIKKSFSFDYLGEKDYYFWDNFWALKGLVYALKSFEVLGLNEKASKLAIVYNERVKKLNRFIENLCLKVKSKIIKLPITPDRFNDYGLIYSFISVYPLNIYDIKDEIIFNSLETVAKNFTVDNKIFNQQLKAFSTLENIILANLYLLNSDQQCFNILNWLTDSVTNLGSIPELVSCEGRSFGEGDYAPSISEYLVLIRNLLIEEKGTTLKLLPFIPEKWIDNNNFPLLEVRNILTKFGKLGFRIEREKQLIHVKLNNNFHSMPKEIVFCFPKTIQKIFINNTERTVYNNYVRIPNNCLQFSFEI